MCTPSKPIAIPASSSRQEPADLRSPSPTSIVALQSFLTRVYEEKGLNPLEFPITKQVELLYNDFSLTDPATITVNNSPEHISAKTKPLASGSQSKVCRALFFDKETKQTSSICVKTSRHKPYKRELRLYDAPKLNFDHPSLDIPFYFRDGGRELFCDLAEGGNFKDLEIPFKQPVALICSLYEKIAGGYVHLHRNNLVHLDGKNENFVYDPISNRAMITDFGCLHNLQNPPTHLQGTLPFLDPYSHRPFLQLPPESTPKIIQDKSTDVYQLARAMEEMLTTKLIPTLLEIAPLKTYEIITVDPETEIPDFNPNNPYYYFFYNFDFANKQHTIIRFDAISTRENRTSLHALACHNKAVSQLVALTYSILKASPKERMSMQEVHQKLGEITELAKTLDENYQFFSENIAPPNQDQQEDIATIVSHEPVEANEENLDEEALLAQFNCLNV